MATTDSLATTPQYNVDEYAAYKNFTNCELAVLERSDMGQLEFKYVVRNESGEPVHHVTSSL